MSLSDWAEFGQQLPKILEETKNRPPYKPYIIKNQGKIDVMCIFYFWVLNL